DNNIAHPIHHQNILYHHHHCLTKGLSLSSLYGWLLFFASCDKHANFFLSKEEGHQHSNPLFLFKLFISVCSWEINRNRTLSG
ncbi:hypothetical protein DERF_001256, partial [Dermatophagoides farinae]